ncbi:MAG: cupredoxin domain-containing protein [Candidatus Pacebacteria bacterium]|nr:cupredoxin domain-containing protein [Candidatus Paceibacterota bacterium]
MNKTTIILLVLAIIVIGGAIIFFSNNSNQNSNQILVTNSTTTQNISTSTKPVAASITISIKNFAFNPSTVNIKTGTKVTWTNNDGAPHTVTSDSENLLESPILSPGQSFSFIFNKNGSTSYHCSIHPMMKGNIVVTN